MEMPKFKVGDEVVFIAVVNKSTGEVVRPLVGDDDILPFEVAEGLGIKNVRAVVVDRVFMSGRLRYELELPDGGTLSAFTFFEDDLFRVPSWMGNRNLS